MIGPSEKLLTNQNWAKRETGLAVRRRWSGGARAIVLLAAALVGPLSLSGHSSPEQNQKKNNKKEPETTGIVSPVPMPDTQAIDILVSQMLGAWQIGDIEMMHKYYADDVTVVSGAWEPPLFGWDNYARAYQAQHARTQSARLERTNSYTKVIGNAAWVTYQWEFSGQVDGNPTNAFGHTTLVLEKRAGAWLIVLNHTSETLAPAQPSPVPGVSESPEQIKPVNPRPPGPGQ